MCAVLCRHNYVYETGEIQTFLHGLLVGGFVHMKTMIAVRWQEDIKWQLLLFAVSIYTIYNEFHVG